MRRYDTYRAVILNNPYRMIEHHYKVCRVSSFFYFLHDDAIHSRTEQSLKKKKKKKKKSPEQIAFHAKSIAPPSDAKRLSGMPRFCS